MTLDLRHAAHPLPRAPCNIDAEQALLGILLYDNAALERLDDPVIQHLGEVDCPRRLEVDPRHG